MARISESFHAGTFEKAYWKGKRSEGLAPGAFFIIAGADFEGTFDGELDQGLSDQGGGLGLRDVESTLVDSVAWKTLTKSTHPFLEGTPAPALSAGKAIGRDAACADTNDNGKDFHAGARTPRAKNP